MYKFIVGTLIAAGLGYFVYLRVLKGNKAVQKHSKQDVKQVKKFIKEFRKQAKAKVGK